MLALVAMAACNQQNTAGGGNVDSTMNSSVDTTGKTDSTCCDAKLPKRFGSLGQIDSLGSGTAQGKASHAGMKFIPAGSFTMGAADQEGRPDEYPAHQVSVKGFWIDETEVTNVQFPRFLQATC